MPDPTSEPQQHTTVELDSPDTVAQPAAPTHIDLWRCPVHGLQQRRSTSCSIATGAAMGGWTSCMEKLEGPIHLRTPESEAELIEAGNEIVEQYQHMAYERDPQAAQESGLHLQDVDRWRRAVGTSE